MKFWEALGVAGVGVVTVAACLGALKDLVKVPGQLWRIFGWHGRFWAFLVRAVRAVDVIISIPGRLALIEAASTDHLAQAAKDRKLLASLVPKVEAIHYQLHPNGGGSAADRLARLEEGVKGLYAPAITSPTVIIPPPSKEAPA